MTANKRVWLLKTIFYYTKGFIFQFSCKCARNGEFKSCSLLNRRGMCEGESKSTNLFPEVRKGERYLRNLFFVVGEKILEINFGSKDKRTLFVGRK